MSIIVSINSFVNGIVWGPYMLALLVGTGIFLTVRSGFMQFRHFGTIFKNTVGILHTPEAHKKNEFGVSPFQAVMTALASTVGTGNITGVATGNRSRRSGRGLLDVDQCRFRYDDQIF